MKEAKDKTKPAKTSNKSSTTTIRVSHNACDNLNREIEKLNKIKKGEKKISASDIIDQLLPLFNEDHKKQLLSQTVTSLDRQDMAFSTYKKKHKETTRSEFLDLIQYGEVRINDYLPADMQKQMISNKGKTKEPSSLQR